MRSVVTISRRICRNKYQRKNTRHQTSTATIQREIRESGEKINHFQEGMTSTPTHGKHKSQMPAIISQRTGRRRNCFLAALRRRFRSAADKWAISASVEMTSLF